ASRTRATSSSTMPTAQGLPDAPRPPTRWSEGSIMGRTVPAHTGASAPRLLRLLDFFGFLGQQLPTRSRGARVVLRDRLWVTLIGPKRGRDRDEQDHDDDAQRQPRREVEVLAGPLELLGRPGDHHLHADPAQDGAE